eukprot:TRINITY_DN375_c0_g1_i1.p1 TRINITY_DN375_c0_g1~~TRINITY_DN375_c0_g1_i1.p1  ORF type:complete len:1056 (+),score=239.67 TRINITY_DN375_c0_g1_i1:133-3300(+)
MCIRDRYQRRVRGPRIRPMAKQYQVFILNASGLDPDTFVELVHEQTKAMLGNLFGQWHRIGFPGGERQFSESLRQGATADPAECLVASLLTEAEAAGCVAALESVLWEHAAVFREDKNTLPPPGGVRTYAVSISGVPEISSDMHQQLSGAAGDGDDLGGHGADYTYIERGFEGGGREWNEVVSAGLKQDPPVIVVALGQTLREARLLESRLTTPGGFVSTNPIATVHVHGPAACPDLSPMDTITALVDAVRNKPAVSTTVDGDPLPAAGGDRDYAVSVQGFAHFPEHLKAVLAADSSEGDPEGGHPNEYNFLERGFMMGARQHAKMSELGRARDPPMVVLACRQTVREARVLQSRLSAQELGEGASVVLHGPGFSPYEPVDELFAALHAAQSPSTTIHGEALPVSGGERAFAVSVQGLGQFAHGGNTQLLLQDAAGDPDPLGGHPENYTYPERGFNGNRAHRAAIQVGQQQEPTIALVAREQTLREARVLECRLVATLGSRAGVVVSVHGPELDSMEPVTLIMLHAGLDGEDTAGLDPQLAALVDQAGGMDALPPEIQALIRGGVPGSGEEAQNNASGGTSKAFIEGLKSLDCDQAQLEALRAADKTTCALCLEDLCVGDVVTELPECGHCFHLGLLRDEEQQRECRGVQHWLSKNNSCPVCRTKFPMEGNPGDWTCVKCHTGNPRVAHQCSSCQTARNVAPAFEQHREVFERAAALLWRLRQGEQESALRGEWTALFNSAGMDALDRGNWVVRGALQRIFDCEHQKVEYTAEDAGAYGGSDVNSRGMLHLFCEELLSPTSDSEALLVRVAALGSVDQPQGGSAAHPTREQLVELVGPHGPDFATGIAASIVHGGSDLMWESAEAALAEWEGRGWTITMAVQMLRHAGVRDLGLLTQDVDARSAVFVTYILDRVIELEPQDTALSPVPAPSDEPAEPAGLVRTLSFGTLTRQVLDQLKEEVGAVEPYLAAVKIMRVLCRNLLAHRSDTKYRRIDLSNQRLHDTCTKFEQARAVLISAGFEPDVEDDGTRVLVVSSVNEDKLMRLVHLFDEELEQA